MEEELSTIATPYWAEGVWTGKWSHEQKEAWMRQIREVQTWKQVRGPAGAVMCETRDLGIEWPCWHTLVFSSEITIDMRFVCPKDVRKMLVQRARSVSWKKWAAKHEYEELKEGAWLEPRLALLRKKVRENWTEKHRIVARKTFMEGGRWTQKRLFDVGWSDVSQCQACQVVEGTQRSTGSTTAQNGTRQDGRFQRPSESWSKKQEPQRRNGGGKEVFLSILSVKANGTGAT